MHEDDQGNYKTKLKPKRKAASKLSKNTFWRPKFGLIIDNMVRNLHVNSHLKLCEPSNIPKELISLIFDYFDGVDILLPVSRP